MRINFIKFCHHCEKPIEDPGEYFFIGYWDPGKKNTNTFHFHKECFKEIAGEEYEIQRSSLIRYYQASKNGKINTTYNQRENVGRYYATRGISLQNIKREFRHTISNCYYVDIDMENCQPRLLYQLCLKLKISCERLGEYVMNRDEILMDIDEDRDVGKNVILSLIFNGGKSYKNNTKIITG